MRGKVNEAAKKLNVNRITPAYAGKRIDLNRVQDIQ